MSAFLPGAPRFDLGGTVGLFATNGIASVSADIRASAVAAWKSKGINASSVDLLSTVNIKIADLPNGELGYTSINADGTPLITIDAHGAGTGWYVDPMINNQSVFTPDGNGELMALDGAAKYRYDLLTVVEHEMGHVLGYSDISGNDPSHNIMDAVLPVGVRRVVSIPGGAAVLMGGNYSGIAGSRS